MDAVEWLVPTLMVIQSLFFPRNVAAVAILMLPRKATGCVAISSAVYPQLECVCCCECVEWLFESVLAIKGDRITLERCACLHLTPFCLRSDFAVAAF